MKRLANDGPEPGRRWRQGFRQSQRASPDRGFCRLDRSGKTLKSLARATVCFEGWPGAPAPARSSSPPSERGTGCRSGGPPQRPQQEHGQRSQEQAS